MIGLASRKGGHCAELLALSWPSKFRRVNGEARESIFIPALDWIQPGGDAYLVLEYPSIELNRSASSHASRPVRNPHARGHKRIGCGEPAWT